MDETTTRGLPRAATGLIRLLGGALLAVAMATQIVDLVRHDALDPGEYFAYFTIESNLANIVVLLLGGVIALRSARDPRPLAAASAVLVPAAIVTAVVYNLVLRPLPPAPGYHGPDWPNEIMHVVIPTVVVLDWLLASGRPRLGLRHVGLAVLLPVLWLVGTLLRGGLDGWYPYPFLDPRGVGGLGSVAAWILGLTLLLSTLGALAVLRTRRRPSLR